LTRIIHESCMRMDEGYEMGRGRTPEGALADKRPHCRVPRRPSGSPKYQPHESGNIRVKSIGDEREESNTIPLRAGPAADLQCMTRRERPANPARRCLRGTPSACGFATGAAVCAALWPRSDGCARELRKTAAPLPRACARCRRPDRNAS